MDNYFVINTNSTYSGRYLYAVQVQNENTVSVNRYVGSYRSPYADSEYLRNRELNTTHQLNDNIDKSPAGGLQSAVAYSVGIVGSKYSNAYIDFASRYVLDATNTRELLSLSYSSYWHKFGYISSYYYNYNIELSHYIATSSAIPIPVSDDNKVKLRSVDASDNSALVNVCESVENGREVFTTDLSKKYAIIPFAEYYLLLYDNGYSVIIG